MALHTAYEIRIEMRFTNMILQSQVLASGLVRTFVKPREGEQEIYQSGFLVPRKRVWGFRRYVREGTQDEVVQLIPRQENIEANLYDNSTGELMEPEPNVYYM